MGGVRVVGAGGFVLDVELGFTVGSAVGVAGGFVVGVGVVAVVAVAGAVVCLAGSRPGYRI